MADFPWFVLTIPSPRVSNLSVFIDKQTHIITHTDISLIYQTNTTLSHVTTYQHYLFKCQRNHHQIHFNVKTYLCYIQTATIQNNISRKLIDSLFTNFSHFKGETMQIRISSFHSVFMTLKNPSDEITSGFSTNLNYVFLGLPVA